MSPTFIFYLAQTLSHSAEKIHYAVAKLCYPNDSLGLHRTTLQSSATFRLVKTMICAMGSLRPVLSRPPKAFYGSIYALSIATWHLSASNKKTK